MCFLWQAGENKGSVSAPFTDNVRMNVRSFIDSNPVVLGGLGQRSRGNHLTLGEPCAAGERERENGLHGRKTHMENMQLIPDFRTEMLCL